MKTTQFVFWLTPILVLSLVCGFVLIADAQDYYPLEIGNTWVLESTDGAEKLTYTIEDPGLVNGQDLMLLSIATNLTSDPSGESADIDKYFVTIGEEGILLHQTVTDEGAFGIAKSTFDPPTIFFPTALPVGHQWEVVVKTELQLVGPTTSTSTLEVVAIEDVETPGGIFQNCVRLNIKRRVVTALAVARYEFNQWLAPDVGPIKFENVSQDVVFELQSYNLVEAPTTEEVPAVEETPATEEVPAVEEVAPVEDTTPTEDVSAEMPVSQMFEITLTNLTTGEPGAGGQVLSAPIFVAHPAGVNIATVGEPANDALVALAEGGDTSGLAAIAAAVGASVALADDNVIPGGSVTVTVTADMINSSLSVGSMLVSTNDAFIAATDIPLFDEAGAPVSTSIDLEAYDAGSEDNTEMASDIPGPLGLDEATDPPESNERVPTEGGVIAIHEGIQGGADVGEAFAWEEPTAMLTITPVEAPSEPTVDEPMPEPVVEGPGFDMTLEPGLNMISIPLMPVEPYTAKSLAEMLGATVVIQLDAATQNFIGYTAADAGDGFGITGDKGYIVNTPAGGTVKFTGDAWDNQPEPETAPSVDEPVTEEDAGADDAADTPEDDAEADDAADAEADAGEADAGDGDAADVEADAGEADAEADDAADATEADAAADAAEGDAEADDAADAGNGEAAPAAPTRSIYKSAWAFIVTSDIQGMETGTAYTVVAENLRTGIIATENITSTARRSSAVWADLNRKSVVEAGDKLEVALYDDNGRIVSGPFQRTVTTSDIRNAFLSLQLNVGDVQPQDTLLAQNFPNPFNPETWIPYQLSEATEVKIDIYNVSGHLVRSLDLGWQPVGSYMTASSAAYWDGKNAVGERVASGIYFYTFQTSDFTATRRMVIVK